MARRRAGAHRRCHYLVDLPDPTGAHGRLPGRLAVVFRDRLFGRLLDDHRRRSRSILRRLRGDRHHPVGERVARVPLRPVAVDAASRRLRVETHGRCDVARPVGIHAPSAAVAPRHRRRRWPPRCACRLGRGQQLGRLPAVPLSGALWRERPALRQGHRLLSLFAARLCRHQELDAAHALPERALRRSDLLGARRHRVRRPAPVDVADSDRPRLGAARLLLRGEGLVLRSRPLSAALRRQRGGGRRELHRHPCGAARSCGC